MKRVSLAEVADLKYGYPFPSATYKNVEFGTRLLRGDNVGTGHIRWDGVMYWPYTESYDDIYIVRAGDIVLAMDRPVLSSGLKYGIATTDDASLLVQRVCRIRATECVDPRYLGAVIGSRDFQMYIGSVTTGSAVPHISGGDIARFTWDLPPLDQQIAVGEVLGALSDKIAANRRVQRSIDDLLEACFRQVTRSASERVELGSLIALNYGKSLPASKRVDGSFPVVGSGGVVGYHDEPLVDGPAVVVGRKGSVGSTYWISEGCFPIDTTYWVAPKGVSLGYSYRLLQDIDFVAMNTDSAVPGLNRERAYALQVPLPNEEQLEEFDRLSEALTLKHSALEKEIAALARTRDELLPMLMNGRITIKDAEHAVEGVL
ncbi:restriction endonuclease subunit S [Dietzia natronolimnaea]|uniref:restriction endonuclease subunit S n=1 Tax=Dietzia natronolimnaea TaxID=161920 RepID=UPI0011409932|nr:restriction endonuclease subunit S [Dietzia natronolimnaea]